MLVAAVVDLLHAEIADPLVEEARHHRLFGELHHAVVHHDGGAARTRLIGIRLRSLRSVLNLDGRRVGVRRLDLDVLRKRHGALEERAAGVECRRPDARASAELRHFGREQTRDLDHRRIVLANGLDVERHQNRVVVGCVDGSSDRQRTIGDDVVRDAAQENAVTPPFPFDDSVAERLPSLAGRRASFWRSD